MRRLTASVIVLAAAAALPGCFLMVIKHEGTVKHEYEIKHTYSDQGPAGRAQPMGQMPAARPASEVGRYQLLTESNLIPSNPEIKTILLLDTETGRTWQYVGGEWQEVRQLHKQPEMREPPKPPPPPEPAKP